MTLCLFFGWWCQVSPINHCFTVLDITRVEDSKSTLGSLRPDPYHLDNICMGPGKPGKSWNFIVTFFQDWEVLEKRLLVLNKVLEICSTQVKNMKCATDSKDNNINTEILGVKGLIIY